MPDRRPRDCPDATALEALATGESAPDGLQRHVDGCSRCGEALREIETNNAFLAELRPIAPFASPAPATPLPDSKSIPGYRLLERLHQGGQGVVYRAIQESTGQAVAVKVLSRGPFAGAHDRIRFEREVRILAQLRHPNVVTILDSGLASGSCFLVTTFIDGLPLDQYVSGEHLSIEGVLRLFARVCEAVGAAHLRGVIHRDLKPRNILIDKGGEPHVLDFGLAKIVEPGAEDSAAQSVTRTGQFMGSLPWASPEQAEGVPDRIDTRTDVYSLGVILFQMLTTRFPYDVGGPARRTIENILNAAPTRPGSIRGQLNHELDTIVLKALSKDAPRRYQSVEALRADVLHYLAGEPIDARRDSTWYVLRKSVRRHRGPLLAGIALITLIAGFAIDRSHRATRLEFALSNANIGRARSELRGGNPSLAEALLWREHLNPPAAARNAEMGAERWVGGSPYSYWALREFYASQPRLKQWAGHDGGIDALEISGDGSLLASHGADAMLRVWSLPDGTPRGAREARAPRGAFVMSFAPTGARIAFGVGGAEIRIWDPAADRIVAELGDEERRVTGIAYLPGGDRLVSSGSDGRIRIWDVERQRVESTLDPHGVVSQIAVNADGTLLAAVLPAEEKIALYSLAERRWLAPIVAPPRAFVLAPYDIVFAPAGEDLAAAYGNVAAVWGGSAGEWKMDSIRTMNKIIDLSFPPGGGVLAAADRAEVLSFWDSADGGALHTYAVDAVRKFCFAPSSGFVAVADARGAISLWENAPHRDRRVFDHEADVHCVRFSPDGELLASCGGGAGGAWEVRIWDVRSGELLRKLSGHESVVSSVAFSPDGRSLASAGYEDAALRLWDLASGTRRLIGDHDGGVSSVAFSPDGRLLAASSDSRQSAFGVRVWDVQTGALRHAFSDHSGRVASVAFSPDGALLASSGSDARVFLRELHGETLRAEFDAGSGTARIVCFTPDGKTLIAAGDDTVIRMWNVATARPSGELRGHQHAVYGLSVSPDGTLLASAGPDREVKLWDIASGAFLGHLNSPDGTLFSSVAFSPSGTILAGGSFWGTALVWDLTYYNRHIAGNLDQQIARNADVLSRAAVARLRSWARQVETR